MRYYQHKTDIAEILFLRDIRETNTKQVSIEKYDSNYSKKANNIVTSHFQISADESVSEATTLYQLVEKAVAAFTELLKDSSFEVLVIKRFDIVKSTEPVNNPLRRDYALLVDYVSPRKSTIKSL